MLWRKAHPIEIHRDVRLLGLPARNEAWLLTGGQGFHSLPQQMFWHKLFEGEKLPYFLSVTTAEPNAHSEAEKILSRSSLRNLLVLKEAVAALIDKSPETAFAAIIKDDVARLLMVGSPTESAWEMFREEALAELPSIS